LGLLLSIVLAGTAFTITPSSSAQSPLIRAGVALGLQRLRTAGQRDQCRQCGPRPGVRPRGCEAAGGHHSSLLTSTGQVLAWGSRLTSGTVTVRESLPAGLTARRMTGSGWSCALAALTCTRSDALAVKGGYPPIELTVQASCRAHGEVTNTATVTGGRDPLAHKDQNRTLTRHLKRCHHAHRR
jgi:hypothetical protein